MRSHPLVSVVTPVYNEEENLAECIESVLAQSYENWDYTIVDNCSTDGTLEVARRYAAIDRRIRVHRNKEFLSVIANHNNALRQISLSSKYSKVVLGDDWIFPKCIEEMVDLAETHPSIGIVGAYSIEGNGVAWTGLPYPSPLVSGREICRSHLLEGLYVFGSANAVLYRSDLVRSHDPFYNEANIHADTEVCFALLKKSDFGFVHQILTFTRLRQGSLNTVSQDRHSDLPHMLNVLIGYGPYYLSSEELQMRLSAHLLEYYRFLGKSLMLGREATFWDYHRAELVKAGVGFSHFRLARGVATFLGDAVVNPKASVERALRRLRLRGASRIQDSVLARVSDAVH